MPRTRIEIIPHLDYAELTQRYRRCRDVKERTRWLVIRLLSRPGNPMKVEQVGEITGLSADWVRKIARRYNATGAEGIVDAHQKSPGGKHKALTKEQLQELFEKLQSPPLIWWIVEWTKSWRTDSTTVWHSYTSGNGMALSQTLRF